MTPRRTLPTAAPSTRRHQDRPAALGRSLAAVTLAAVTLLAPGAFLLTAPVGAQEQTKVNEDPEALLVIDPSGAPVPGVELAFVDRLPGTSLTAKLTGGERSDDTGWIRWPSGGAPEALDVRSADPNWAVAYVYAERTLEAELGSSERLATLDLRQPAVCVLERTGTLEIEVVGAGPEDRFHATWTDARPEPASHLKAQASVTFTGPRGRLRARAGRGTLYLTRDGSLGAAALRNGAPLLVSLTAGETSTAKVRLEDGPETLFIAPFDTIQFQRLQALAPDGERVVADLDFESSPLRVPSVIPVSVDGDLDGRPGARPRLPKHLMRAVDAPASLSSLGPSDAPPAGTRPGVERAPVLVVFPVDLGGKLRFPEVEQGWIRLAQQGNLFLTSQPFSIRPGAAPLRSKPGVARLDRVYAGAVRSPGAPQEPTLLQVASPGGEPAAHREVLVVSPPLPAFRALTDDEGRLEIRGARFPRVEVLALGNLADRITVGPLGEGEAPPTLTLDGSVGAVRGKWAIRGAAGRILMLVPGDEELKARGPAGTRAAPLCLADARGEFHFGPTPAGDYRLRIDGVDVAEVQVRAGETTTLAIDGNPPKVKASR